MQTRNTSVWPQANEHTASIPTLKPKRTTDRPADPPDPQPDNPRTVRKIEVSDRTRTRDRLDHNQGPRGT
jgi:hypothetical protein